MLFLAFLTCANALISVLLDKYYQWGFAKQIGPVIDLVTKYSNYELNEAIYTPAMASIGPFYAPDNGNNCPNDFSGFYDGMRAQYYPTSFCNDKCTILITTSDGGYLDSSAVNSYLRQEAYLSCNDSFSVSNDALKLLKQVPPVQLIEQYAKCSTSPSDAIQNAIGIATGWVGLITPITVMIIIALISFYYSYVVGIQPPTDDALKEDDLQNKFNFILERYEEAKKESNNKITTLQKELDDAKKLATITQVDLIRLKKEQKEKEKTSSETNDVLKTISFGLV